MKPDNPFIVLKPDFIYKHPYQPLSFGDYQPPKNFPNCCDNHKNMMIEAKKLVGRFPNCCSLHKKMAEYSIVNIAYYKSEDFARSILTRISYTEHHIEKYIDEQNWYKIITDYIEYIIDSFGTPSFGDHVYKWAVTGMIELRQKEIGFNKVQQIIDYINGLYHQDPGEPIAEEVDINELYHIYQKWLSIFPFNIEPFNKLKEKFTNIFPVIEEPTYNPYTRLTKGRLITKGKLVEWLIDKTKEILKSVDSAELLHDGLITDVNTHRIDLLNAQHKTRQAALLKEFSTQENHYVQVITKWLSNEEKYYRAVMPLLAAKRIDTTSKPSVADTRPNNFNSMKLDEVEKWFIQLAENSSKNGEPFLTVQQVAQFIERAFVGNTNMPAPTLNATDREKGKIVGLFHLFYEHCNTHQPKVGKIDPLATAERYIRLLTGNLDRWTFDEVKNNFRRAGNWKKPVQ